MKVEPLINKRKIKHFDVLEPWIYEEQDVESAVLWLKKENDFKLLALGGLCFQKLKYTDWQEVNLLIESIRNNQDLAFPDLKKEKSFKEKAKLRIENEDKKDKSGGK